MEGGIVQSMEQLLTVCSRSIVAPELITREVGRVMSAMSDCHIETRFLVEGCETLSLLASGFLENGFHYFISDYSQKTGIDHWRRGFVGKEELISFCEYCVAHGNDMLIRMRNDMMAQLEVENGMTKDEIMLLNQYQTEVTVQEQIIEYIKLSLLVNSLTEFFKKYYRGLN